MYQAVIVIHILLGLSIIGLILIQQGKGADAGAGFGGGASGSVFGAQGAASFLSRTTAILATCFFITSLGLAWMNSNKPGATDFMSSSSAEEKAVTDLALPDVKEAKPEAGQPAPAPAPTVTADKPVIVPPATPAPAAPAETETPAPAAEQKPEQDTQAKEVVKEPEPKPKAPKHESAKGKKK